LSHEDDQEQDRFQSSYAYFEKQEQEIVIIVNHTNMAHEEDLEYEEIEEQHSSAMLMDFEEELRFLEEWLEKPNGEEDYLTVANIEHPRMNSCNIVSEEVGIQYIGLSCEDVFLLHTQHEYADQRIVLRDNKENEGNQETSKGTYEREIYEIDQSSMKEKAGWRSQLSVSNTFGEVYEE